MPEKSPWEEKFRLRTSDVDATGSMRIATVADYFQEVAGTHAGHLGVGAERMHEENLFWVLSFLEFKVAAYPAWRSEVVVSTWPTSFDRFYAGRRFHFADSAGQTIVEGESSWLVVDLATRRPCHVPEWIRQQLSVSQDPVPRARKEPFPVVGFERSFQVRYHDLDINQHVNNMRYIEWIAETVPDEILLQHKIAQLQVSFRAEAQLRDRVLCQTGRHKADESVFYHRCVDEDSGRELIRAKSIWQPHSVLIDNSWPKG